MRLIYLISIITLFLSCHCKRNCKTKNEVNFKPSFTLGPQAIIYKTKKNYIEYVALTLSEDKNEIVSYPHPNDVYYNGELCLPTKLKKDFLLDNRGINKDVAFLKIKYKDYSQLKEIPQISYLKEQILEKNPLVEICNCGNRDSIPNLVETINKLIETKKLLEVCKKLN